MLFKASEKKVKVVPDYKKPFFLSIFNLVLSQKNPEWKSHIGEVHSHLSYISKAYILPV